MWFGIELSIQSVSTFISFYFTHEGSDFALSRFADSNYEYCCPHRKVEDESSARQSFGPKAKRACQASKYEPGPEVNLTITSILL